MWQIYREENLKDWITFWKVTRGLANKMVYLRRPERA